MKCRHCKSELAVTFLDLGSAPPSNAYLSGDDLHAPEKWYPLRVLVCGVCWLVQTEDHAGREELFAPDYAYFSSFSSSWLQHAEAYADEMTHRFGLGSGSIVAEVAANDGYLLQFFRARGIACFGVEPTASTAAAARNKGLDIVEDFFGVRLATELAAKGRRADLVAANNVLAHVPDIDDFVRGFSILLKQDGVATFEFPHLLRLVEEGEFDTVYHEHYSYLSLSVVRAIFDANGLAVFDVEELTTHGGSLRVFAQQKDSGKRSVTGRVDELLDRESATGIRRQAFYADFQVRANEAKNELLRFLLDAQAHGELVVAYGAAAKGNTLLNYAGVRPDLLPYVVDRNPAKQGRHLPGSRIPIVGEHRLREDRPAWVLILPWNIKAEVMQQLDYIGTWGGGFVTAIPNIKRYPSVVGA